MLLDGDDAGITVGVWEATWAEAEDTPKTPRHKANQVTGNR